MRVVLVTAPVASAETLASTWIEAGLCACVNLLPVRSVYRWKGEVQRDDEVLLVIKVSADRVDALRRAVHTSHPYDVPEFVVLEVDETATDARYLDWVRG